MIHLRSFPGVGALVLAVAAGCGGSSNNLNNGSADGGGTSGGAGASDGAGGGGPIQCKNSLDCPKDLVCDTTLRVCVQCTTDNDCTNGQRCGGGECHSACVSDKDCTPQGKLCDPVQKWCVAPGGTGGTGGVGSGGVGGGTGGVGGGTGGTGGSTGCTLDMMIVLDHSGSMADSNKWASASAAVKQYVAAASGMSAGLQFFPIPPAVTPPTSCTIDADCGVYGPCLPVFNTCSGSVGGADSCLAADYAAPAVTIGPLPDIASQFTAKIDPQTTVGPVGGSALNPALGGAIGYTRSYVAGHAGHTGVVVMITDGTPNGCTGNDEPGLEATAANGLAGTPSIKTFVIGIDLAVNLQNQVAYAGGTGQAIIVDPTSASPVQALVSALNQAQAQSCF